MAIGMFIGAFAIAFSKGWLMTVVVMYSLPAIGFTGMLFMVSIAQRDAISK